LASKEKELQERIDGLLKGISKAIDAERLIGSNTAILRELLQND